jgi:hypothetical protein
MVEVAELGRELNNLGIRLRRLKRFKKRTNKWYVPNIENRVNGLFCLWGRESGMKILTDPEHYLNCCFDYLYEPYMSYSGKLREVSDKISFYERKYDDLLARMRGMKTSGNY